jgi:anthranilate/para-aminobenzoate synthase component I
LITELEFKSLAQQGYNRIPLIAEAFADLETPLSLYLKLAHAKGGGKLSFLLESVVGGERFGRYSFIGLPARTCLRATGFGADAKTEVVTDGQVVETAAAIRWTSSRPTRSASRWRCARACRASAAAWPATSATTRCATSRRSWKELPARHAGLPRHPAAAVRGAGGHRQPLGQAVPDRLRRPGQAGGLSPTARSGCAN